jgi:hypothetical protein
LILLKIQKRGFRLYFKIKRRGVWFYFKAKSRGFRLWLWFWPCFKIQRRGFWLHFKIKSRGFLFYLKYRKGDFDFTLRYREKDFDVALKSHHFALSSIYNVSLCILLNHDVSFPSYVTSNDITTERYRTSHFTLDRSLWFEQTNMWRKLKSIKNTPALEICCIRCQT